MKKMLRMGMPTRRRVLSFMIFRSKEETVCNWYATRKTVVSILYKFSTFGLMHNILRVNLSQIIDIWLRRC
jgi:hypothetical protein